MTSGLRVLRNFVNGEFSDAASGATSDIINPSTATAFATAPVSGRADLDAAYSAAATAFESWGSTTPAERQRALLKIADALEARADEFVAAESAT